MEAFPRAAKLRAQLTQLRSRSTPSSNERRRYRRPRNAQTERRGRRTSAARGPSKTRRARVVQRTNQGGPAGTVHTHRRGEETANGREDTGGECGGLGLGELLRILLPSAMRCPRTHTMSLETPPAHPRPCGSLTAAQPTERFRSALLQWAWHIWERDGCGCTANGAGGMHRSRTGTIYTSSPVVHTTTPAKGAGAQRGARGWLRAAAAKAAIARRRQVGRFHGREQTFVFAEPEHVAGRGRSPS